jgi:hypothetical protein
VATPEGVRAEEHLIQRVVNFAGKPPTKKPNWDPMETNKAAKPKPVWTCPQCQRKFAKANRRHSCGMFTVEQYLDGKPLAIVALFDRLIELAKACGPVIVAPTKSMVLFKARTSFAEVKAKKDRLDVQVVFRERVANPRFRRTTEPWPGCIVHSFQVEEIEQLDDEVAGWLKEAYEMNLWKHSAEPSGKRPKRNKHS